MSLFLIVLGWCNMVNWCLFVKVHIKGNGCADCGTVTACGPALRSGWRRASVPRTTSGRRWHRCAGEEAMPAGDPPALTRRPIATSDSMTAGADSFSRPGAMNRPPVDAPSPRDPPTLKRASFRFISPLFGFRLEPRRSTSDINPIGCHFACWFLINIKSDWITTSTMENQSDLSCDGWARGWGSTNWLIHRHLSSVKHFTPSPNCRDDWYQWNRIGVDDVGDGGWMTLNCVGLTRCRVSVWRNSTARASWRREGRRRPCARRAVRRRGCPPSPRSRPWRPRRSTPSPTPLSSQRSPLVPFLYHRLIRFISFTNSLAMASVAIRLSYTIIYLRCHWWCHWWWWWWWWWMLGSSKFGCQSFHELIIDLWADWWWPPT